MRTVRHVINMQNLTKAFDVWYYTSSSRFNHMSFKTDKDTHAKVSVSVKKVGSDEFELVGSEIHLNNPSEIVFTGIVHDILYEIDGVEDNHLVVTHTSI